MKFCLVFAFFALISTAIYAQSEADYQREWCGKHGGIVEYKLPDRTRVDCMVGEYAIEFDFARKWAEATGQATYYAAETGKIAGIVLIMETQKDCKYLHRLNKTIYAGKFGVIVFQTGAYAHRCGL